MTVFQLQEKPLLSNPTQITAVDLQTFLINLSLSLFQISVINRHSWLTFRHRASYI